MHTHEQFETGMEGPQLPEKVCATQDSDSADGNMMTQAEPTTPQIVTGVNNVKNSATSEPINTSREGAFNAQKYKYSRNRIMKHKYRNRKRKRDNLPSYNSQIYRNLGNCNGNEIVEEEGSFEIGNEGPLSLTIARDTETSEIVTEEK